MARPLETEPAALFCADEVLFLLVYTVDLRRRGQTAKVPSDTMSCEEMHRCCMERHALQLPAICSHLVYLGGKDEGGSVLAVVERRAWCRRFVVFQQSWPVAPRTLSKMKLGNGVDLVEYARSHSYTLLQSGIVRYSCRLAADPWQQLRAAEPQTQRSKWWYQRSCT